MVAKVLSDIRPIFGSKSVNHGLGVVLEGIKFGHMLRQEEAERQEAGLEWPRLQWKIVGVLHDTLERALPHWNPQEVGQPQQLALYRVPILHLMVENDQQRVSCVDVALVPCRPLPPFIYSKLRPLFPCIYITRMQSL